MALNQPGLSPEIISQLTEASRKLHDVLPLLDKATACGIDVSQLRETHNQMRQQIDAYQSQFFPAGLRP